MLCSGIAYAVPFLLIGMVPLDACILAEKHGCMYPYFIKKYNSENLF
ncbi:hypothetical protein Mpsy_2284 [Methanolobus psychrophilus R15]|nr:hypothetical protein Mpsy_2284 [Methanolobus psychrophilus R15]